MGKFDILISTSKIRCLV